MHQRGDHQYDKCDCSPIEGQISDTLSELKTAFDKGCFTEAPSAASNRHNKSRETSDLLSLMLPKSVRVLDMGAQGHIHRSGWHDGCEMALVGQHPPA
eukprot:scaffold45911_cov28-Attheya_sp.AAC.1